MLLYFLLNSRDFSMRNEALHPGLRLRNGTSSIAMPGVSSLIALADAFQTSKPAS